MSKTSKFNQAQNLISAGYLLVTSLSLLAWNRRFAGSLAGFSIPSLLAILAFGYMWVHYLSGFIKANTEEEVDTKRSFKVSQYFVLVAIIAHPIAIILRLKSTGYGLPPASFVKAFGAVGAVFISFAEVALIVFLAFEFKKKLKSYPKLWQKILSLNDLAMLLIILHGFKLGYVVNGGWFKYVWLAYGLTLLIFFYDKYVNKRAAKRYVEGLIVGLFLFGAAFVYLCGAPRAMIKSPPKASAPSSAAVSSGGSSRESISKDQLAAADGLSGHNCWVVIDGDVYDLTGKPEWRNGYHQPSGGLAKCGQDLTRVIGQSPHGKSVLGELDVVGKLKE